MPGMPEIGMRILVFDMDNRRQTLRLKVLPCRILAPRTSP